MSSAFSLGIHIVDFIVYPVSQISGVTSTIDNDLYGTGLCIGVDTALNTAMEAVDRLRVTTSSHRKASLGEVMGTQEPSIASGELGWMPTWQIGSSEANAAFLSD
jgi:6-phosphofructokinase 1